MAIYKRISHPDNQIWRHWTSKAATKKTIGVWEIHLGGIVQSRDIHHDSWPDLPVRTVFPHSIFCQVACQPLSVKYKQEQPEQDEIYKTVDNI